MKVKPSWSPILMVVSAPSGAGKTTLCERLMAEFNTITYSVSCTTRQPRVGEVDGKNYTFLTEEAFQVKVDEGAFLEYAEVHGYRYGTPRNKVVEALAAGKDVIMDLDVQGAAKVRSSLSDSKEDDVIKRGFVDIFIAPPSMKDLQLRLFGRGKDEAEVINRRLVEAKEEMRHWDEYTYLIFNDRLEQSYDALRAVFLAEHQRVSRMETCHE